MHILFISRWFPDPPSNGSKLRVWHLLRGLSQQHRVTLVSFTDQPTVDLDNTQTTLGLTDVKAIYRKPFNPSSLRARLGYFSLTPRAVIDTFSPEMAAEIRHSISSQEFDIVIASQYDSACYAPYFTNIPALFEEVELGVHHGNFQQASSGWERFRRRLTWFKHQAYLRSLCRHFFAYTVVSEEERALLSSTIPYFPNISIIPNGVDLNSYRHVQASPVQNNLIFTGSFQYHANYEAMQWFLEHVYPIIQAEAPEVQLSITGDHANKPLPSANNVTLTGYVDDIYQLIADSWISIVPIQIGGGTRVKILEALALKTPVVTTTKGAEGLEVEHNKHLLIADTPTRFAEAVLRLINDPSLRSRLVENGYRLIREKYDWSVILPRFMKLVEHISTDLRTSART